MQDANAQAARSRNEAENNSQYRLDEEGDSATKNLKSPDSAIAAPNVNHVQ